MDQIDEDTHAWVSDGEGVQRCANAGCTVRRTHPGSAWQRWKGAHWRKITREAVPTCTGAKPAPAKAP